MDPLTSLRRELEKLPVTQAYVFGSHARGTSGPLSDVDVAIVPHASVPEDERLQLQGRVSFLAADAFGTREADVILLDEAPPGIAFHAISGRLVLDRDPARREMLEARIMSSYHDRQVPEERWERETLARYRRGEFA